MAHRIVIEHELSEETAKDLVKVIELFLGQSPNNAVVWEETEIPRTFSTMSNLVAPAS
jgi:hypothetical protein